MRQFTFLKVAVAAAMAGPSIAVLASDGTVAVSGSISGQTCTLKVNGTASTTSITLPSVDRSALRGVGTKAGETPFSVAVTACATTTGTMNTFFEPGSGSINTNGRVTNSTGTATGVEVEIVQVASSGIESVVDMSKNSGAQGTTATTLAAGAATQNFRARYHSTSATPAAGTFIGTFNYSVVYN